MTHDCQNRSVKNLRYELLFDFMDITPEGKMEYRERIVVFRKRDISHIARMITYVDIKKGKQPRLVTLLTNDFEMRPETIVAIYCRRWQIESLFKQIKQNIPLRYFYGESENAIKIQIWVTLITRVQDFPYPELALIFFFIAKNLCDKVISYFSTVKY